MCTIRTIECVAIICVILFVIYVLGHRGPSNPRNEPLLVVTDHNEEIKPTIPTKLVQSTMAPIGEVDTEDVKASQGYIFPYSVYEEQTCGARNVWQLQVLANELGMNVVEPFAADSMFRMNGMAPNFNRALRFRDYFDKDKWDRMAVENHIKPLVSWEEFLSKTPRKAIILYTAIRLDRKVPLIFTDDTEDDCIKMRRLIKMTYNG